MDFLKTTDFFTVIQPDELTDVVGKYTEITDLGSVILDTLELEAIGEMTGYLAVRFDASKCFEEDENNKRIAIIIQKCVDIVLYNAYASVHPNNVPKLRSTRYENAVNWLEKVASGYINPKLPTKADQPKTPLRYNSSQKKLDNFF